MNHIVIGVIFTGSRMQAYVYFKGKRSACKTYVNISNKTDLSIIRDTEKAREAYRLRNNLETSLCIS